MKISMPLSYASGVRPALDAVADLERAGLDQVWIAEAYGIDAVSQMGYLASTTSSVEIGSGILPIYTRTPTLLAMTAAGLDMLSDCRCVLGLGASGPQVIEGWHGVRYDFPLARTREIVDICRKVWRRDDKVVASGPFYELPLPPDHGTGLGAPLKLINKPVRSSIPIYLAALGERNVALTAEIADGWLPLFFLPDRAEDVFGESLARGHRSRDGELEPLEICAGGVLCIAEQEEADRVLDTVARPTAALYVGGMGARGQNFYNSLFARYGYESEAAKVQELYLSGQREAAAAAIPMDFLRRTNLCGPAAFVSERVAAYAQAGVTTLNVTPVGDRVSQIASLRSLIA